MARQNSIESNLQLLRSTHFFRAAASLSGAMPEREMGEIRRRPGPSGRSAPCGSPYSCRRPPASFCCSRPCRPWRPWRSAATLPVNIRNRSSKASAIGLQARSAVSRSGSTVMNTGRIRSRRRPHGSPARPKWSAGSSGRHPGSLLKPKLTTANLPNRSFSLRVLAGVVDQSERAADQRPAGCPRLRRAFRVVAGAPNIDGGSDGDGSNHSDQQGL